MKKQELAQSGYTQKLAEFASEIDFEDLPSEVVHETKRIILDTIGCTIGGYTLDKGKIVAELARDLGGSPEASVFVSGDKVSCANAAFANAEMANALDADECFLNCSHFANVIIADALAVAENIGASGKDLIAAVALGFDIAARIHLYMVEFQIVGEPPDERMEWSPVAGNSHAILGGAAAAGKLLGFDREKMADALGLAGISAPPNILTKGMSGRFSMAKYAFYGIMAHNGILAALLAKKGYAGDRDILDGDIGLWRLLGAVGVNWDFLADDLGKKWWIMEDALKLYPCCRALHPGLDLFYETIREQRLRPDEIESVTYMMHPAYYSNYRLREPWRDLDPSDPFTQVNLEFSTPFAFAMAALGITPGPEWFSRENMTDPRVKKLMDKIKVEENCQISSKEILKLIREEPTKRLKKGHCAIVVKARGKEFVSKVDCVTGDPWSEETKLSDDQLKQKFRDYCKNIIPKTKVEKAIKSIYELEKLDNVAKLANMLTR